MTHNSKNTSQTFVKESIHVFPQVLSFGCLGQGLCYKLPVTLVNKSDSPQIFKVRVVSEEQYQTEQDEKASDRLAATAHSSSSSSYYRSKFNESQKTELNRIKVQYQGPKLASGMSSTFNIEFYADFPMHSHFIMTVHQSVETDVIVRPIRAFVVNLDVFKCIRRTLVVQGLPVLRNGVTLESLINQDEGASVMTGPSVYSELLMDDDDVDELCDIPLTGSVCWDPDNKCLKVVPELLQVKVDSKRNMTELIENVEAMREKCYAELENNGLYTLRIANRYVESKSNFIAGSPDDGDDGLRSLDDRSIRSFRSLDR